MLIFFLFLNKSNWQCLFFYETCVNIYLFPKHLQYLYVTLSHLTGEEVEILMSFIAKGVIFCFLMFQKAMVSLSNKVSNNIKIIYNGFKVQEKWCWQFGAYFLINGIRMIHPSIRGLMGFSCKETKKCILSEHMPWRDSEKLIVFCVWGKKLQRGK